MSTLDFIGRNPATQGWNRQQQRMREQEAERQRRQEQRRQAEFEAAQRQRERERRQDEAIRSALESVGTPGGTGGGGNAPRGPGGAQDTFEASVGPGSAGGSQPATAMSTPDTMREVSRRLANVEGGGKEAMGMMRDAREMETDREREVLQLAAQGNTDQARHLADSYGVNVSDQMLDPPFAQGLNFGERVAGDRASPEYVTSFATSYKKHDGDLESVINDVGLPEAPGPLYRTFRDRRGNPYQVNTRTGEREYLDPPDSGDTSQRQRKIAELRGRPGVQQLAERFGRHPRDVAADLVDDRLRMDVVPETGSVRVLDTVNQKAFEVGIQNAQELAGNPAVSGGQRQGQARPQDQSQNTLPAGRQSTARRPRQGAPQQGQPQAGSSELAQTLENNRRQLQDIQPSDIFGPNAVGQSLLNNTLGQLTDFAQFPDTEAGRTAYNTARELAAKAFRSSGRVPQAEQERILGLLPKAGTATGGGLFENPDTAPVKINAFLDQLETVKRAEQQAMNDPNVSPSEREKSAARVRTFDQIQQALSNIEGVGGKKLTEVSPDAIQDMSRRDVQTIVEHSSDETLSKIPENVRDAMAEKLRGSN